MMMVITAVAATESYGNSNEEGGGMEASCLPKLPIVRSQPGSMLRVVIVSFSEQKNSRRAFACMYSFCTGWPSDGYILTSGFPPYASLLVGFSCTRADRFRWSVGSSAGSVQLIDPFFFLRSRFSICVFREAVQCGSSLHSCLFTNQRKAKSTVSNNAI